jgi:cytochrome c551/c552
MPSFEQNSTMFVGPQHSSVKFLQICGPAYYDYHLPAPTPEAPQQKDGGAHTDSHYSPSTSSHPHLMTR